MSLSIFNRTQYFFNGLGCDFKVTPRVYDHGCNGNIERTVNGSTQTPLFFLISQPKPNIKLIKTLIDHGCNVNAVRTTYEESQTPLYYLISQPNPNIELIKLLLDNGCDVNKEYNHLQNRKKNPKSKTPPLCYLLSQNKLNIELIKLIIEHGCDVNRQQIKGKELRTPLYYLISQPRRSNPPMQ